MVDPVGEATRLSGDGKPRICSTVKPLPWPYAINHRDTETQRRRGARIRTCDRLLPLLRVSVSLWLINMVRPPLLTPKASRILSIAATFICRNSRILTHESFSHLHPILVVVEYQYFRRSP